MTEYGDILMELRKLSKITLLANASIIEAELTKVASTNERKKVWMLIDGNRMPKDIASSAGISAVAVSYFLSSAITAGLVEYNRGEPPRRLLDYVPPAWLQLLTIPVTSQSKSPEGQTALVSPNLEDSPIPSSSSAEESNR